MAAPRSNARVLAGLVAVVALMVGASFAAVPLYSWFCRVTGYGGTTGVAEAPGTEVVDRLVTVVFDANTAPGMPWEFRPKAREMTVRLGETGLAFYEAYNPTGRPTAGQAAFNVVPFSAGGYFDKIACFCFELQVLGPGERVEMPVTFFVDPALLDDRETEGVERITLSYTMYPAELPEDTASAAPGTATELAAAPAGRATLER
jgi:cytochrome c oxidase assembly protein subunit 11